MKVIILAAGRGTRISKKIGDIPKSMVDIGGITLLKNTINMLKKHINEQDISIVVGYNKQYILNEFADSKINFYINPFYAITNSIASLWFASSQITQNDDLIIANGDVFWTEEIYQKLISSDKQRVMLSDKTKIATGDYFFKELDDHSIIKYGKELELKDRTSEYLGIAKIEKNNTMQFKDRLLKLIDDQEIEKWWENVLYSLIGEEKVYSLDVDGSFWAEVDYIEDYERILNFVQNKK